MLRERPSLLAAVEPGTADAGAPPKRGSLRWLMALNFTIADVQNGMGPYVALFLQSAAQWNPAQIGTALAFGNIAQVAAQTPAGVLIDQLRQKRALLAVGIVMIALACLFTPLLTTPTVVAGSQMLIGVAGALFPPTLAAIALGLVGRRRLDGQMGTNQAFNAAGNAFAALAFGVVGYFFSLAWMFALVVVLCGISLVCVWRFARATSTTTSPVAPTARRSRRRTPMASARRCASWWRASASFSATSRCASSSSAR